MIGLGKLLGIKRLDDVRKQLLVTYLETNGWWKIQ